MFFLRFGDFQNGVFRVLNCHGSEEKLLDCHYKPVLEDVCYKDVAIKCSKLYMHYFFKLILFFYINILMERNCL